MHWMKSWLIPWDNLLHSAISLQSGSGCFSGWKAVERPALDAFLSTVKELSPGKGQKCTRLLTEPWTLLKQKLLPFAKRRHHIIKF